MKRIFLMVAFFVVSISSGLPQVYTSPNPVVMPGAGPDDVLKLDVAEALDFTSWMVRRIPDYSKYGIKGQVLTQGSYMDLWVYKYTGETPDGISYFNATKGGREVVGLLATRSQTSNLTGYEMEQVDIHHVSFKDNSSWWTGGYNREDVGPTWDGRQVGNSLYNWGMITAAEYFTGQGREYVQLKHINFDVVVEVEIHGDAVPKELSIPGVGIVNPLQLGYTLSVNLKEVNLNVVDLAPGISFGPESEVDALNYAGSYTPPKKVAILRPGQQTGFAEVTVPSDGVFYVAATDPSRLPAGWTYEYAKGEDHKDIFTANVEGEAQRHFHYYKIAAEPGSTVLVPATDEGPFVVASAIHEGAQLSPASYALEIFRNPKTYPRYALLAAHRGYWADAGVSENTVEACQLALDLGADMLEVDVRLSGDDVPMLLHDACLDGGTVSIKTKTALELMAIKTRDRFGDETQYYVNSLKQLLDALGQKAIITLDIKDTGADWDKCFKACLALVRDKNLLDRVIFKGPTDRTKIETLMQQVHESLNFNIVQYTPVLYGDGFWTTCGASGGDGGPGGSGASGGGPGTADGSASGGAGASGGQYTESTGDCFADFKNDWYSLMEEGKIKAVETHFKVGTDPLLQQGVVKWLQDNGVRVGIFAFTADQPQGVVNTNNDCVTTVREYFHNPRYASNQKPEFLNDGRGNLDFIYKSGAPTYIIHDRPDLVLKYLHAAGLRDLNTPVITRIALPDTISLQGKTHKDFDGIALKIHDVRKVEFFTPNPKDDGITIKPDLVAIGESLLELPTEPSPGTTYLVEGVTPATVHAEYYNGRTSITLKTSPETCAQVYGSLTDKLDEKNAPFSSKFQFPNRTLAEWSKEYPDYDIYLNSNYWSTNGITGTQSASVRPEFWLPCTDVYGFWVSNGVRLSNIVDAYDPSSRTAHGCAARDELGNCTEPFDGRFDTFIVYEDGEVEMVSVAKIYDDHYIDTVALKRNSDNKEILHATSGYIVATGGVIIPPEAVTQKFNNDQVEKMRTVMGINGREMYILSVQEPQLEVREVAELMVSYYGCTDVMINDSGRSTALLTSVGNFPGCKVETAAGIVGCTTLNGLDDQHLAQFYGADADPVYRNIGTFLAIKAK